MFSIRPARFADDKHIQKLIRQSRINPTGLDWRRFLIAVDLEDHIIGCGQIKPHHDGSRELASIAVIPEWRHRGVASAVIRQLLKTDTDKLFLVCRSSLGSFYEQFGFHAVEGEAMPPYFRRINRLARWVKRLEKIGEGFLVMCRDS